MPRPSRFLTVWVVALLVLAGAVAGFNALVDPYDVFGRARIAGFNDIKPRARNHPMLTKTYQIERAKPATVLIGSSRTYVGIDAASPAWPAALKPVYNYAKPELYSAATGFRSLQEAVGTGHLKHAFIFLELQFFLSPDSSMNVDPDDARRYHQTADGAPNPARQTQVMKDMFLSTFSMGALTDSVLTVAGQHRSPTSDIRPDGSALVDDFPRAATAEGEYSLFFQKELSEQNNARGFARDLAPVMDRAPNLDIVKAIIALCARNGVELTIVLTPYHADSLEFYWRNGLWPRMEQVKSGITALAAADGRVKVWDFADYNEFTTETVPGRGDRAHQTRWFWEPVHFKREMGERMLAQILSGSAEGPGALLTPETIGARLAAVRVHRDAAVCGGGAKLLTVLPDPPPDRCGGR